MKLKTENCNFLKIKGLPNLAALFILILICFLVLKTEMKYTVNKVFTEEECEQILTTCMKEGERFYYTEEEANSWDCRRIHQKAFKEYILEKLNINHDTNFRAVDDKTAKILRDYYADNPATVPDESVGKIVADEPVAVAQESKPKTTRAQKKAAKVEEVVNEPTKAELAEFDDEWVEDDDGNFVQKGD